MKKEKCNKELMELISHGVSPFHAVEYVVDKLKEEGYEELRIKDKWKLKKGGKYYIVHHGTTMIAFAIGRISNRSISYGFSVFSHKNQSGNDRGKV